jgi:hypothetical protein
LLFSGYKRAETAVFTIILLSSLGTYANLNPNKPTIFKDHQQHAKGGCQLNGQVYREMPLQTI